LAKLLIWAVIILAVLLVSRILNAQKAARLAAERRQTSQSREAADTMVRCAHCHIYLPRAEAYMSRGQTFCCAEHARLGLKR
jgi:uncharacterized protein